MGESGTKPSSPQPPTPNLQPPTPPHVHGMPCSGVIQEGDEHHRFTAKVCLIYAWGTVLTSEQYAARVLKVLKGWSNR